MAVSMSYAPFVTRVSHTSSSLWPVAAIVNTAFLMFRGSVSAFEAVPGGTVKTLGMFCSLLRAETGKIKSAGITESPALKNEAVSVTLKGAV